MFKSKYKPKEATVRINAWIEDMWDKWFFKEQFLHLPWCEELWDQ